jgi:DnaJ family protein A protein 5
MLITKYNTPLGFMLTFSLLALYFPKHSYSQVVEEGFETVKTPIYGEDKNIVDDEKKSKNNKKTKTSEPTKKNQIEEEEKDKENEEDEEDGTNEDKENKEDLDEDEVKDIGLEKLNPGYYKNKSKNETKTKTKTNPKNDTTPKKEQNSLPKSKDSETFLGDVRQVIKDLDTGRGGMNASNAIKSINNLFYNKHKTNIKKIIAEDDDESEDDEDEDFF